jgi:RNA polymerase sigma-70 factor (ECF subfamily)
MALEEAVTTGLRSMDSSGPFLVASTSMLETLTFEELIRRVRAWDQQAATELVRRYEPMIRRTVRFRLADARLDNLLESMDISQSVLKSFFVRAAAGQFDLETPEQLLRLLATMAKNKLISASRRHRTLRRGGDHRVASIENPEWLVEPAPGPGPEVAARDLLQEVLRRLSPDERRLQELRNDGHDWATIASRLGGSPEALRKQLSRAIDRVAEQLGLDDEP